jgi:hypothetical protein
VKSSEEKKKDVHASLGQAIFSSSCECNKTVQDETADLTLFITVILLCGNLFT